MKIACTFDLRDDYPQADFSDEDVAEFDTLETVQRLEAALISIGHDVERVGHVRSLTQRLARGDRWDLVFNFAEGLHGFAREAQVPALLDAYQIPYTFSDGLVLALTLHKGMAKHVVRGLGIPTPDFAVVSDESAIDRIDLPGPLFVKPVASGSSVGVSAASLATDSAALRAACLRIFCKYRQPAIVETFLPGRELTVGIVGTGARARALGVMEVLYAPDAEPHGYSYWNKKRYTELVQYRIVDDDVAGEAAEMALRVWTGLGCRDAGRVDCRCDAEGRVQFLEVNPLAGLSSSSDLPILAGLKGISFQTLIEWIVASASERTAARTVQPVAASSWHAPLRHAVTTVGELAARFPDAIEPEGVERAAAGFNLRITPEPLRLIGKPDDPIWRQYVPAPEENVVADGVIDPLAEDGDSPVPNITHRYPDRVLFLVSPVCAAYCRFCTRRRKVGDPEKIPLDRFEPAFAYIEQHREIRDVILSGGDPLMLSDRRIEYFLAKLRAIPHVEIVRLHTRIPSQLPERVTPELVEIIKRHHPVFVNVHVNHPDELTAKARQALARLADAGCPLGSQTVLLKGVNDDAAVMKRLMQELLRCRVRPYYLYQADAVAGGEHFRTTVDKGLEIMEALRGWTSGLAVPHYVIDAPGGGGKVPLQPDYVLRVTPTRVVVRNYAGTVHEYPLPSGVVQ